MRTRLCRADELIDGSAVRIELAQIDVVLVKSGAEIFALEDACSHAEFPLSDGDVLDGSIECSLHGSRFDLRTGAPSGPPATLPVKTFPVSVVDGDVYLDLENHRS